MKAYANAAVAALTAASLAGCSLVNGQITPSPALQNDIQIAYTAICGPGGLLDAAQPFATTPNVVTYYNDAKVICANGVPSNEIVAGVDIFSLYLDLSQALSKKATVAKAKVLMAHAHRA
jgi:hypothetical protein